MKSITTKVTLSLIAFLVYGLAIAQDSGEIIIPLSKPGSASSIEVEIYRGSIEITGTNRQDVLLKYKARESKEKSKSRSSEAGLTRISSGAIDLEASENNNHVEISSSSHAKGVDVVLEVPSTMNINAESYLQGKLIVRNVAGEHVVENYNGAIEATGISGSISASTYNGDIIIDMTSVTSGVPMSYNTYNGDIDISLPANTKASLKMKSTRGEVLTGFEVAIKRAEPVKKTDSDSGTYKVYLDDWVTGDINGGGPLFTMKNYNGDIIIRKK